MATSRCPASFAAPFALVTLAACGGGGGGSPAPVPTATPTQSATLQILVPGEINQRAGTQTVVVTYASPSATQSNSSASYAVAETDTVSTSASGAPAPLDLHRVLTYTANTRATAGIAPATQTFDDYETLSPGSNGSETVTLAQAVEAETGTDESAVAAGGTGAYTLSTTSTYSPAQIQQMYPLVSANSFDPSLAHTTTNVASDGMAGGTETENTTTSYDAVDSFSETGTVFNGDALSVTENSNGSATENETGPTPFTRIVAVPAVSGSGYVIPVTTNGTSATIADYYPGAGLPPTPLGTDTVTVVGPATSLPAGCPALSAYPNVIEIRGATSDVNVIDGSVTATTTQNYNSNGLNVCRASTTTTQNYSLKTGALSSTTVTTVAVGLTSTNLTTAAKARAAAAPVKR